MAMQDQQSDPNILELTAEIVSAHVSNNSVPLSELPGLIQEVFRTLSAVGTLSELKPDRSGTLTAELAGYLRFLFPALTQEGVREGMQWTDSTSYPLVSDAFTGSEQAVTVYRASDKEEVGEREAIPLETSSKYSRSGKRVQADQELEMTASGTRTGVHRLSLEGVLVSAQGSDAGEMTISVPAVGQTVPVTRSSTYAVTPLASGP